MTFSNLCVPRLLIAAWLLVPVEGGFMSHSLGMLYPDVFAAVASVAGGVPPEYFPYPRTNRFAISVMELHNKADSVVPFDGVPAAMLFWRRFNDISGATTSDNYSEVLTQERYSSGATEVVLLHFDDNSDDFGHHWPREKFCGFEAYDPI
jgi:poly(3-hydroxybutyrate) depolymerase